MALDLRQWNDIGRALWVDGVAAELEEQQPGWRFRLDRTPNAWGRLLLDDGWAGFEAPLPALCAHRSDLELLELNAVLPRACRIGLRAPDQPRLLLDVAIDDGDAAPSLCQAGMARVIADWSWLGGTPRTATPVEPLPTDTLLEWIRAGGWICEKRESGRIAIDLETHGHHQQIYAQRDGEGRIAFAVPIARRPELPEASLSALARYLLRVSGRRRLVGGSLGARDACAPEVRFEVRLDWPLDVGLVGHALAALALTVHTCGREARAIAGGPLGGHYTAMWPQGA